MTNKPLYEPREEDEILDPELVAHAQNLLVGVGMMEPDDVDPHTARTPQRLVHYLQYLLPSEEDVVLTCFPNDSPRIDQMIVVPHIPFWSACVHHCLPFVGTMSVGYVPGERVMGLSKIPLYVRAVARGFWMQEHLGHCIADEFERVLEPLGVAVHIRAMHTCQLVKLKVPPAPEMVTTVLRGYFHPLHLSGGISRDEFFKVVYGGVA